MIRYLEQEEKIRTRVMYEENFPEDSRAFIDYYYANKTKDNQILVMEEEKLQVMIHLNPYAWSICGEEAKVDYVVAVATDASVRRQGKMAEVMERALKDMAAAHQPFTFLIPANPKVYASSGFVFVPCEAYAQYRKFQRDIPGKKEGLRGDIVLRTAAKADIPRLVSFANRLLEQEYDIFPYHTREYYERAMAELASQDGAVVLLEREGELAGCFSYGKAEGHTELQEILVKKEYRPEFMQLAERWLAAGEAFREADRGQPEKKLEEKPVLEITDMDFMVRITDLKVLCLMLRSEEAFSLKVCVKDALLPSNEGCYEIRADQDGSSISSIPAGEAECTMEIGELTGFLFEKMKFFIREWV